MPSSTFRAWVVGLIWAIIIPGVNQFFFFRFPSITIGQVRGFFYSAAFLAFLGAPLLKLNPSRKDCPPGADFSHLQSLGSLPAEYFHLRHPA
jgi:hypothetical protein